MKDENGTVLTEVLAASTIILVDCVPEQPSGEIWFHELFSMYNFGPLNGFNDAIKFYLVTKALGAMIGEHNIPDIMQIEPESLDEYTYTIVRDNNDIVIKQIALICVYMKELVKSLDSNIEAWYTSYDYFLSYVDFIKNFKDSKE